MQTHSARGVDLRWRACRCCDCGFTAFAISPCSFYAVYLGGPLRCLHCFILYTIEQGGTVDWPPERFII